MSVWMKHTACAESEKQWLYSAMEALKTEGINNVSLIAFTKNDIGNAFWKENWLEEAGRFELLRLYIK